jgi:hypothetical protein
MEISSGLYEVNTVAFVAGYVVFMCSRGDAIF